MDSPIEGFILRVVNQVEPYVANKSTIEKMIYFEQLVEMGENFSTILTIEENLRKKLLGSLQQKVVVGLLRRVLELLENSVLSQESYLAEQSNVPNVETFEDASDVMEKLQSFKRRFDKLQETLPIKTVSFVPLADEMVKDTDVRSSDRVAESGKVKQDNYKRYLSFLQLPEPQDFGSQPRMSKMEAETTHKALLRRRRGEKSEDRELMYMKDSSEIITSELLSLTKQLKGGSEEVYEALKRDQERLGKLANVVDSNLSHTGKQLKLMEQFKSQSRKTSWQVWFIISLLPLLWLFVYLTIRFH